MRCFTLSWATCFSRLLSPGAVGVLLRRGVDDEPHRLAFHVAQTGRPQPVVSSTLDQMLLLALGLLRRSLEVSAAASPSVCRL